MNRLALSALLALPLTLVACGEDTGARVCTVDGDCAGGSCDQVTGTCFCTAVICGAMNLECLDNGTCGTAAVTPDMGMMSMGCGTVGEQGTCDTGQICQDDGTCAPETMNCGVAGTEGFCTAGQICTPAGTCEARCDNAGATGCVSSRQLCDFDTQSTNFNMCAEAQSVTGTCPNAAMHQRVTGGPILVSIEVLGTMGITSPNCTGDATVQRFRAELQLDEASDMLPGSLFTQGIKNLGPDGMLTGADGMGLTFSDGPASATHPSSMALTDPGNFTVEFSLCLSAAQMMQQLAVYINDDEGEASNAFCFSAL